MWRGFGAETDNEPPAQRSYFRPRISSISGVLAMTKQRLFTMTPREDSDHVVAAHTASIHPTSGGQTGAHLTNQNHHHHAQHHHHLLTDAFLMNGLGAFTRCPSPARSSFGDVISFSRSASARPSIDSQTAHAIFGDPLGLHDPSEAELGGVCHENTGPFAKRSSKILRGLLLMIIVTFCWLSVIHLFRLSFHRERILLSISAGHLNISKTLTNQSNQNNFDSFHNNSILNNDPTINHLSKLSSSNISTNTSPINSTKSNRIFDDDPVFRNKWSNFSLEMLPTPMSFVGKPSKYRNRLQSSQSSSSSSSSILNNEYPRSKFDAPYMMTWYCTIWNVFYLPVYLMIHMLILNRKNRNKQREQQQDSTGSSGISTNPFGSNFSNKNGSHDGTISSSDSLDRMSMKKVLVESIQGLVDRGFTMVQFFWRCTFFSLLCLLSNYMLIFSLRILDATIVMALVSTSVSVVYLLSWVVLHQQFVGIRIVGIIIVDTGVALLVYMDGIQHQTLAAVMMAFGSAIIYAVYRVFMRRMIGFTTFGQMALFHSLIGLMNIFFAWPLILILYATGVEIIQWGEIPWLLMTGASVCSIIAQLIASFGVICTYEFFLALGIFFAVPASAVIDLYLNSVIFKDMKLSGVLLICFGFLVVLLPENWNGYLTDAFRNRLKKWKNREENKKNGRIQDTTTGHLSRLRTSSGRVK